MKHISWGFGIAVGIGVFVIGVLVMVGISFSARTDLVTERYYEKGIGYQDRITALQRAALREERLEAGVDSLGIIVTFPRPTVVAPLSGTIILYRPADRLRDLSIPVAPDSLGVQRVPVVGLDRGLWHLKVSWKEGELEYYSEQPLMVM